MNLRSISYQPKYSKYVFWVSVLLLTYLYGYHHTVFYPPQSIHQYRQCDCLSIAQNYYRGDMNFFKPELHNQMSQGGKNGYAAGEFPLIYYSVAVLWKIFGYHEFIFRLVEILIVLAGLFSLFRIFEDVFKDSVWALILSLLLFTSPILVFYSSNFLTNMPAFGFALIGWYFFHRFSKKSKQGLLYLSIAFFLLAGLLKVSAAISLVLLFCLLLTEMLGILKLKRGQRLFNRPIVQIIPFLLAFLLIFCWYWYASWFNNIYGGGFTFNSVWPIWKMSAEQIQVVWKGFMESMIQQIFDVKLLWLTGFMFVMVVVLTFMKKIPLAHFIALLILIFGTFLYSLFWFNAFGNHDYYLIDLLMPVIAVWLLFFLGLRQLWEKGFQHIGVKFLFMLILGYNVLYCRNNMQMRYWMFVDRPERFVSQFEVGGWAWIHDSYVKRMEAFTTLPYYFEAIGVKPEDKIISLPDESINVSLVLMNHKGWTSYGLGEKTQGERIKKLMQHDAKYLLISDSAAYNDESIRPYLSSYIGSYQNIDIYDLRGIK